MRARLEAQKHTAPQRSAAARGPGFACEQIRRVATLRVPFGRERVHESSASVLSEQLPGRAYVGTGRCSVAQLYEFSVWLPASRCPPGPPRGPCHRMARTRHRRERTGLLGTLASITCCPRTVQAASAIMLENRARHGRSTQSALQAINREWSQTTPATLSRKQTPRSCR